MPDSLLTTYLEQKNMVEQTLIGLEKDLGPKHTQMEELQLKLDDLNGKIKDRAQGILTGLGIKVLTLKTNLGIQKRLVGGTE